MTSVKDKATGQGGQTGMPGKAAKDASRQFTAQAGQTGAAAPKTQGGKATLAASGGQPAAKSSGANPRKEPSGPKELAAKLEKEIKSDAPVREQLRTLAANPLKSRLADAVNAVTNPPARTVSLVGGRGAPAMDADQSIVQIRLKALNNRETLAKRGLSALARSEGAPPDEQKRLAAAAKDQVLQLRQDTLALNAAVGERDRNRARLSEAAASFMAGTANTIDRINSTVVTTLGFKVGGPKGGAGAAAGYDATMGMVERQIGDRLAEAVTGMPVPDSIKGERNLSRVTGAGINLTMMGASSLTNAQLQAIQTSGSPIGSAAFSLGLQRLANTERWVSPSVRSLSGALAGTATDGTAARIEDRPFDPMLSFMTNAAGEGAGEVLAVAAPALTRRRGLFSGSGQDVGALLDRPVRMTTASEVARMSPGDRRKLAEGLDAEFLRAAAKAGENPVTPVVRNKEWLTRTAELARSEKTEMGVFLMDSNNFSRFNRKLGDVAGDEGIEQTSQSLNAAAARFNQANGGRFVATPGRDAGDEMFAAILPHPSNVSKTVPDSALREFTKLVHEEVALRNATSLIPIPTGTSSAKVIKPGDHRGGVTLAALLDSIDHEGPGVLHAKGAPFFKNGGVVIEKDGRSELVLGPTYGSTPEQMLSTFRRSQGGLTPNRLAGAGDDIQNAYAQGRWNVSDGERARPQVLPGALPTFADTQLPSAELERKLWGVPDIAQVDWSNPEASQRAIAQLEGGINAARKAAPLESVFRNLAGEGISVLHQGQGLARLQYMLDNARASNRSVTMTATEPRGLKDVNDRGKAVTADGSLVPVAHGGGNVIIENMVRAQHQALVKHLGPDHEQAGLGFISRDRGKRFTTVLGPDVSMETVVAINKERDQIYRQMLPTVELPDGTRSGIVFEREGGGFSPFQPDMSFAAARAFPGLGGPADALGLRDSLVAPLPYPDSSWSPFSALDIAKDIVDGKPTARPDLLPAPDKGLTIWVSEPRDNPAGVNRRETR